MAKGDGKGRDKARQGKKPVKRARRGGAAGRFLAYTGRRFLADECPLKAAGLSYVSLLAIVPLIAIGFAVLVRVPAFAGWRDAVQAFLLETLVPEAGAEASEHLASFIENAGELTGPGLVFLAVAATLLIANVASVLNAIWRVADPHALALRFLVYWILLLLGPLLVAASLSVSSYAFAAIEWFGIEGMAVPFIDLSWLISVALAVLGFAFLFFVVPARPVHPGHALLGGLVAATLLELLKLGFGLYVTNFPAYQVIYGALAAVPIFLLWLYLAWIATLFGAEIAAALPEWRAARARGRRSAGPGVRIALALSLLSRLRTAARSGGKPREPQLSRGLPATPAEVDMTLRRLRRAGLIARGFGGRWTLSRNLGGVTLLELVELLGLSLLPGEGWPQAASSAVEDLASAGALALGRSIDDLLEEFELRRKPSSVL
jgi:membrane protein